MIGPKMEEHMDTTRSFIKDLIASSVRKDIEKVSEMQFSDLNVPFEGIPQKHMYDKTKVILMKDPFSEKGSYWEFPVSSISRIEECDSIVAENGQTAMVVRLWVRKGTKASQCKDFTVL